jgi:hypothetical protein
MKNRKFISLPICLLLIIPVFPVLGLPIQIKETTNLNLQNHQYPKKTTILDDAVISMIEQVNESAFLSYEENLTINGPRPTKSPACVEAAEYIYEQFETMGLAVKYHRWNNSGYSSYNVEATLEGANETSDEIYIICAHYDTVSVSPGADDDTSGTAAVLIAASIMSHCQFNHTIKFVAFSGEEEGLLGSEVYAQEAHDQGWDIIGVLNCDMISYAITTNDGNNLNVCQNNASAWLYNYSMCVNMQYSEYIGPLTLHDDGYSYGSDQFYFWQNGYDAIFYHEYQSTPYYHTANDTIAHINLTYGVKNTRLILATLAELAEPGPASDPPAVPLLLGPETGFINELCTFTAVTTDPDGDDVYYDFDWGDGTNSGWIGPYHSGQQAAMQKSWDVAGTYSVRVKAEDINQVSSGWSTPLVVTIADHPPNTPTIQGPTEGKPHTACLYRFTSIDLDGDLVYYYIDWGDGQVSDWIGPYNSGVVTPVTHTWDEKGNYTIRAKAKDSFGAESGWATCSVTMPSSYPIRFVPFWMHVFERFPHGFPILRHILSS